MDPMNLPGSVLHTTWISSSQGIPQFPLEVAAGQIEIPRGEHGPGEQLYCVKNSLGISVSYNDYNAVFL